MTSQIETAEHADWAENARYGGFIMRLLASLIDTAVLMLPLSIVLGILFTTAMGERAQPDLQALQQLPPEVASQQMAAFFMQPEVIGRIMTENLISLVVVGICTVLFWYFLSATPGKLWLGLKIVDAKTGLPTTKKQDIGRYLGYFVSIIGLMLGFIWVVFDSRHQGWHDKLAGTVVVYKRSLPEGLADLTRRDMEGEHGA